MNKKKEIEAMEKNKSLKLDEMELVQDKFYALVAQAVDEAILREINANTIMINENLRYVKPFYLYGDICAGMVRPMIMGMGLEIKKLPKDIDFIVYEKENTPKSSIKSIEEQAVKAFAVKFDARAQDLKGYGWDEYNEGFKGGVRETLSLMYDLITELYGAEEGAKK